MERGEKEKTEKPDTAGKKCWELTLGWLQSLDAFQRFCWWIDVGGDKEELKVMATFRISPNC